MASREADAFAGKKSFADTLKERRQRIESGDLTPSPTIQQRKEGGPTPVQAAEDRVAARIERMRKAAQKNK
jgi:hypothetical protein